MAFNEDDPDKTKKQVLYSLRDKEREEDDNSYISLFSELKAQLNSIRQTYIETSKQIIGSDLYLEDFFFLASIDKGIRLLDGLQLSLESRNITCSAVLYRAQIDLCMRTYAAFIAENPQEFIEGYLAGKPVRSFTDKAGKKMIDSYLREQLDLKCPGLSASYCLASDFVHFSRKTFSLIAKTEEQSVITMGIGVDHGSDIDASLIDLGNAVIDAANLHLSFMDAVIKSRLLGPLTSNPVTHPDT